MSSAATLTLGGRTHVATDEKAQARFRKEVALLLAVARQASKLDALRLKQKAWLDAHLDDARYLDRLDAHEALCARLVRLYTDLHMAKCHASNAICDLYTTTLDEISASYGSDVTIASPEAWMLAAFHSPDASDDDVLAGKVAPF